MDILSSQRSAPTWLTAVPIAHRGLHTLPHGPENSLAAFTAAVAAGFPIELDVRLLADGEVVVFHDSDLQRLTGEPGVLEEQTTAGIQKLRLLETAEHIPRLSEALDMVAGRVPLLIEIKTGSAPLGALERATLRVLAGYTGEFALQSFSPETVDFLAVNAPNVVRGQLSVDDGWFDTARALPDFIAYYLHSLPTPQSSALRAKGLPLLSWTIQTEQQQRLAAAVSDNCIFEGFYPTIASSLANAGTAAS